MFQFLQDVTEVAKYFEDNAIVNEAVLYYKNGGNNADKDSLFLILTPGAGQKQIKKANLLMGSIYSYNNYDWNSDYDMVMTDGINTPYGVYNKYENKLFKVTINDFSVRISIRTALSWVNGLRVEQITQTSLCNLRYLTKCMMLFLKML